MAQSSHLIFSLTLHNFILLHIIIFNNHFYFYTFVAPRVVEDEYDEDGVRAPIPQKQETLIQPGKFFHKFFNFRFFFSKLYFFFVNQVNQY